jgi:type IV secretion system protein VirB2
MSNSLVLRLREILTRLGWVGIAATAFSSPAFAQITGGTDPSTILTNIGSFILGGFGQSLAGLGIVAIGLSWMFGRASLGLVAGVIGGIVIMFGASYLTTKLVG